MDEGGGGGGIPGNQKSCMLPKKKKIRHFEITDLLD